MRKQPLRTETETSPSEGKLTDFDFGYDRGRISTDIEASFRHDASSLGMGFWLDNVIANLKTIARVQGSTVNRWSGAMKECVRELSDEAKTETDSAKRGIVQGVARMIRDVIDPYLRQSGDALRERLEEAWDMDGMRPIIHALGCAGVKLEEKAKGSDDRDWIDTIRKELSALPQVVPEGGATREQMIDAATAQMNKQGGGEDSIVDACEELRHEAAMRDAPPLWEWLQQMIPLSEKFSDPKDALFLKGLVAELRASIKPREMAALTASCSALDQSGTLLEPNTRMKARALYETMKPMTKDSAVPDIARKLGRAESTIRKLLQGA